MSLSRRDFTRLATLGTLTAVGGGAAALVGPSAASAANSAYVFGYFKETPNESGDSYALHLAVSADGLNWRSLNQNNPVATPTAGTLGLRDPFILRKQDGTFVVLATDLRGPASSTRTTSTCTSGTRSTCAASPATAGSPPARPGHPHLGADRLLGCRRAAQYAIVYSANQRCPTFSWSTTPRTSGR